MNFQDLDRFVVDCKIKKQQIAWLQSVRPTAIETTDARIVNQLQPWKLITNQQEHYTTHAVGNGRYNWLINQHLMKLAECPNN